MNSAPKTDWKLVDETLRRLAREVAQRDAEIGHWLLAAEETKPWLKAGMRSIYEYVERLFGWTPHTITERIRTAKALLLLPRLEAELAAGRMNWSVIRELTRVATVATEDDWIEFARHKTVRTVEKKVAKHVQGERPTDPGDISRVRKRMYFNFSTDQFAVVAAGIARLRKHDPTLTDEEAVTMMASSAFQSATATAPGETPRRPFRLQVEIGLDGTSFLRVSARNGSRSPLRSRSGRSATPRSGFAVRTAASSACAWQFPSRCAAASTRGRRVVAKCAASVSIRRCITSGC